MPRKMMLIIVMSFLLFLSVFACFGQDNFNFKVGDTVYANVSYGGCVKATVTSVRTNETLYRYTLHIEEGTYKGQESLTSTDRIRDCKQIPANDNQTPPEPENVTQQKSGQLNIGDRVDVYLSDNKTGKARGTIIAVSDKGYKVHYDGCKDYWDEWVNVPSLRPAAAISANNEDVKFLTGKWAMTTVGISDGTIAWGTSPGIQVNADGSYIWFQEAGKAPVKGKWMPHAKIEGAKSGTEILNGILLEDDKGVQWKMYRRKSTSDTNDHITIEMMCQGITKIGTRIQ